MKTGRTKVVLDVAAREAAEQGAPSPSWTKGAGATWKKRQKGRRRGGSDAKERVRRRERRKDEARASGAEGASKKEKQN